MRTHQTPETNPTPDISDTISAQRTAVRKSVLIGSVIGIILCCAMAYMASQLALFSVRGDPEAQDRFLGSVFVNQLTALLAYIILSHRSDIRSLDALFGKPRRISFMDIVDAGLVTCFLMIAVYGIGEDPGHFLALMSFTTFPCGLVVICLVAILMGELDRRHQSDPPASDSQ